MLIVQARVFMPGCSILDLFTHSHLVGGVVGMGPIRTKITFRTDLRLSSLRSTVWASSAQSLWDCTWIMTITCYCRALFLSLWRKTFIKINDSNPSHTESNITLRTHGTLIWWPAGDPLHIGLSCSPRIWAEGSSCTGFTLAGWGSSRKGPLSTWRAQDGGSRPTAPETRWAWAAGVVCKPWKVTAFWKPHSSLHTL